MVYTGLRYSLWLFLTRLVINKFHTVWNPTLPLGLNWWKCSWICLLWNNGHFVQGEMSLVYSMAPHTFACDWLAQDSAVCCVWTSVQQSRHYRTDSTLVGHYVDQSWYTPTMVADAMGSNSRQAISNHHADLIMFILRVKGIILHPLNKQCVREIETSATSQFLCYWRPLTTITWCS